MIDNYWEIRYKNGNNSGCGSYGKLAEFKATIINSFIKKYNIKSIIDYGVGDGNQLKLFNLDNINYVGLDISPSIISKLTVEYPNLKFYNTDTYNFNKNSCELVLSCDVLYHLIDINSFTSYIDNLLNMASKYIIIYARNEDLDHASHVKFREFCDYILAGGEWFLVDVIGNSFPQKIVGKDNSTTSPSDFYIFSRDIKLFPKAIILDTWNTFIKNNILKLVGNKPEGSIYNLHNQNRKSNLLINKQFNLVNFLLKYKPTNVLEIGFNSGCSTLLMKLCGVKNLTVVDIGMHSYTLDCYNTISNYFNDITILLGDSKKILPNLHTKYDLIHIDGDHSYNGAKIDIENSIKLLNTGGVIIFDDTNIGYLNNLCNEYNSIFIDYNFEKIECGKYRHRFLQKIV